METGDSTFARRQIGKQLRYLRETSGVSVDVVKKALGVSTQTIWRMETGQPTKIGRLHIKELCRLYGAPESTMLVLLELLEGASRKSWWHAYGDAVPRHFDLYLGLESAASKLVTHQPSLLPGLVQTEEYRRALIWAANPEMPTEEVERRVELATRRQTRLNDPSFEVEILLNEAALRHQVGGWSVMAEQLDHIAAVAELPTVTVRVVPLAKCHIGLAAGRFNILTFPASRTAWLSEPPVVYLEGYASAQYLERPAEVDLYETAAAGIRNASLDRPASRNRVIEIAKEHRA
ncbi:helix-turn-helix domain-containing protein [Nocardia cyriacigeorgica]|jgi:transcriptional regulator with XRE-family HTH domain|uniref:helix-turn-helix domain-containing protein n=1 Tax=Nocardia cyriacigeorgica TaxID=135487 RepID=UPI000565D120|nr:helix-turn-helix transcriptional regulator [Nocardia cyriacigeorgica]AVH24028.1 XRE family transcriptional regulator [Nocardia cyriacigeorgica]MBF6326077.1 helix-turn-helix domain-containing protein [Nocardia cyriacigeorgica]MBF6499586.1 helix-turn-helix domain-containing protein [Nocardia cyriacigeorgica]PPJ09017.1 XRE family transcriptional regulator [Nocardia cyriacigeorgica]TLF59754.1 helix-turn-helix domain-containing protein [Nocardia cyriacigeorgica]